ncbi:hypothetical protein BDZ45DRAFT_752483 [Acephala macrosclerotiorum]|nr:hypothetical protein BDZ45DRAFT_752483 [Acephala macrosclerotiorum]
MSPAQIWRINTPTSNISMQDIQVKEPFSKYFKTHSPLDDLSSLAPCRSERWSWDGSVPTRISVVADIIGGFLTARILRVRVLVPTDSKFGVESRKSKPQGRCPSQKNAKMPFRSFAGCNGFLQSRGYLLRPMREIAKRLVLVDSNRYGFEMLGTDMVGNWDLAWEWCWCFPLFRLADNGL